MYLCSSDEISGRIHGTNGMTLDGLNRGLTRDISRSNTVRTWGRAGYIDS